MPDTDIVSREQWLAARAELLLAEKAMSRARDELAAKRRTMPRVLVDEPYVFDTEAGPRGLADLFTGKSQLVVYHFMYGPNAKAPCKSCSYWADNFDGARAHLRARDAELVVVSRGPLDRLLAFRARMGWRFPWVSSGGSDFNYDFGVSFRPEEIAGEGAPYNYGSQRFRGEDAPGMSVFAKDGEGRVLHTYSTYARGLDALNGAYQIMDLLPKGRDEASLPYGMAWLRYHDEYESAPSAR
jgi:predicted dithiol-disulfide oxidoreductase (DUF899 family)